MNNFVVLPVILPLVAAIALLFLHGRVRVQRVVSLLATAGSLAVAIRLAWVVARHGIQVLQVGNWPAPYGITLVADRFATLMVVLSAIIALTSLLFAVNSLDRRREQNFFHPLFQSQLIGINLAFLTGDVFNLFVSFEIMLVSSYILLTLGGEGRQLREGFKYVVLNSLASLLFLIAVATLYGMMGTLNMADLAVKVASAGPQPLLSVVAVLFLLVFGLKGGVFPLYYWLPESYPTAPAPVAALFAALLTKVGVYAMIRLFTLVFIHDVGFTHTLILWIAGGTMLFGVLGAIARLDMRRILSYHIISQVGYMVMGLGLYSLLSLAGAVYYIAHHIIVKSCLFLVSGITERVAGTSDLRKVSGLMGSNPGLAMLFLTAALSLAGLPPLSGFFSKFVLAADGLAQEQYPIVAVSLLVSLLTLFSMLKIFRKAFWGLPTGERQTPGPRYTALMAPAVLLVTLSILMGLGAEWMMQLSLAAAEQLWNPHLYITSVLQSPELTTAVLNPTGG